MSTFIAWLFFRVIPCSFVKLDTSCPPVPLGLFYKFNFTFSLIFALLQALMHETPLVEGHINLMVHMFHDEV